MCLGICPLLFKFGEQMYVSTSHSKPSDYFLWFFQANLLLQHVCKAGNGSIPKPPTKETKYKKGKKDKEKKEKEKDKEKEKEKEAAAEAKVCTVSFELFRTEVSTYCYWHSYNIWSYIMHVSNWEEIV